MARPRDSHGGVQSTAFQEKSAKEREKLQTKMARQLKIDMETLLEEEIHPDLTLLLPGEKVPVHSAILKARAPFFFQDLLGTPTKSKKRLDSLDSCQVKFLLKQIYTADDLTEEANLVKQWVAAGLQAKRPTSARDKNANTMRFQSPTQSSMARKRAGSSSPARLKTDSGGPRSSSPRSKASLDQGSPKDHGRSPPKDLSTSTTSSDGEGKQPKKKRLLSDATTPEDGDMDFPVDEGSEKGGSTKEEPAPVPCNPLGASLLDMFRLGIGSDITLVVDGKKMRAHQCILCARSPYFAAMLGGSWRESDLREIKLEGVSSSVFQQVLLYMYGGVISLTKGCSLMEIIAAADMYGMLGLKEVAGLAIKMEYCHFFHKPCAGCLAGVPDAIALAYTYGLEELLERALRWSGRHLARLWSSKTFALLPQEVLDRCCEAVIQELSTENVIDMATECDKLMGSLPQVRWSEPVVAMATQLMEGCIEHIRNHCDDIISTPEFTSLGMTMALGLSFLEDVFGRALLTMPTERACPTYMACQKLLDHSRSVDCTWNEDFRHLVQALNSKCEHFIMMYINQVVDTGEWNLLTQEKQKKIKEGAWFVTVGGSKRVRAPPVLPSSRPKVEGSDGRSRPRQIPVKQSSNRSSRTSASPGHGLSGMSNGADNTGNVNTRGSRNPGSGGTASSLPLASGRARGAENGVNRRHPSGGGGARPKSTGSIGLKLSSGTSKLPAPSKSLQDHLRTHADSGSNGNSRDRLRGRSHSPTVASHSDQNQNRIVVESRTQKLTSSGSCNQDAATGSKTEAKSKSSQPEVNSLQLHVVKKGKSKTESKLATRSDSPGEETKEKTKIKPVGNHSQSERGKTSKLPTKGSSKCDDVPMMNGHRGRDSGSNSKNLVHKRYNQDLNKEKAVGASKESRLPKVQANNCNIGGSEPKTSVTRSPPPSNIPTQIPRNRPRPKSQAFESSMEKIAHEQVKRSSSAPPEQKSESKGRSMLPVHSKQTVNTKEGLEVELGNRLEVELCKGNRETVLANLAFKNIRLSEDCGAKGNTDEDTVDHEDERSLSPCSNVAVHDSTSTGFDMTPSDMESESGFDNSEVFSFDVESMDVEEVPECDHIGMLPWEQRVNPNDDGYISMKPNSEGSLPDMDVSEEQLQETVNSCGGVLFHVELLPPDMEVNFMQP